MLKRCFTLIYSNSYRNLDENILVRALMYEICPDSELKITHQCDYFNLMSFKKPSNNLLSLLSKFEPKIPDFSLQRLLSIVKLLLYYDTRNLKFYEMLIENLSIKTNNNIRSCGLIQNMAKHYICFGDNSSKNFSSLIDNLLLKINIKDSNDFTFIIEFIQLMNCRNLETSRFSNLLQIMIIKSKVYEIELILHFFKEFYKYSMTYIDFYYPIAEYFINYDNVLTPTKLEFFLRIMNISPRLQNINLLKRQLEFNVFINNSNLAKIFFKCYLLADENPSNKEATIDFFMSLIKVFKKNHIDYNDRTDLENVKKIYFVCYKLNLLKYDKENVNLTKLLRTELTDKISNILLEEELAKMLKWK